MHDYGGGNQGNGGGVADNDDDDEDSDNNSVIHRIVDSVSRIGHAPTKNPVFNT